MKFEYYYYIIENTITGKLVDHESWVTESKLAGHRVKTHKSPIHDWWVTESEF